LFRFSFLFTIISGLLIVFLNVHLKKSHSTVFHIYEFMLKQLVIQSVTSSLNQLFIRKLYNKTHKENPSSLRRLWWGKMERKFYEDYVNTWVLVNEPEIRLLCLNCTGYVESDCRKVPEWWIEKRIEGSRRTHLKHILAFNRRNGLGAEISRIRSRLLTLI
jgi:hypothetical protein